MSAKCILLYLHETFSHMWETSKYGDQQNTVVRLQSYAHVWKFILAKSQMLGNLQKTFNSIWETSNGDQQCTTVRLLQTNFTKFCTIKIQFRKFIFSNAFFSVLKKPSTIVEKHQNTVISKIPWWDFNRWILQNYVHP